MRRVNRGQNDILYFLGHIIICGLILHLRTGGEEGSETGAGHRGLSRVFRNNNSERGYSKNGSDPGKQRANR